MNTHNGWPEPVSPLQNGSANAPESGGEAGVSAIPTPRLRLTRLADVARETRKIFAEVRAGKLAANEATKLVYILTQLSNMIVDSKIEDDVAALEKARPRK